MALTVDEQREWAGIVVLYCYLAILLCGVDALCRWKDDKDRVEYMASCEKLQSADECAFRWLELRRAEIRR